MLPLMHAALQGELKGRAPLVRSCGPVMDRVLAEALSGLCPGLRLLPPEEHALASARHEVLDLPRWDLHDPPPERAALLGQWMRRVAEVGPRLAGATCPCGGSAVAPGAVVMLDRSELEPFYAPGGAAEIKGYGRSRRALSNLHEAAEAVARAGWPVAVYEPGAHAYGCQVATFAGARALVGIRGAEWANLIWTRPGTPVFMVCPTRMRGWPFGTLVAAKAIEVHQAPAEGMTPAIEISELLAFLAAAMP